MLAQPALILRIQPDEGMSLTFGAKLPGPDLRIRPVEMDFDYGGPSAESRRRPMSGCCWTR